MPTIDEDQNWVLLAASETDTHTILKFKRPLYSCDPYDRNVTVCTMLDIIIRMPASALLVKK